MSLPYKEFSKKSFGFFFILQVFDRVPLRANIHRITKKKKVGNRKVVLFLTEYKILARLLTEKEC